ncbi:HD domain-containing protein [Segatella salivae]|uniref:HD domain-containing protein n=1 Tax=Segatella salivae TaxID=228604 RepID=UPI0028DAFDB1|nr:HD domain-containing protein [Segatella salivae]
MQQVSLEIMEFIEHNILPKYTAFGKSHGLQHVNRVIKKSIELANYTGADINMVYVIAAYHDLGMSGPRAIHHLTGGKILSNDSRLKKWFNADQLKIMKEAVEDHRASSSHTPRTIYGKIVAEADRDLELDVVFSRAIQYGLENYPELNKEQQWKRFEAHMNEKYSRNGYIHLWIPGSPNAKKLKNIQETIDNKTILRAKFEALYTKEKNE